MPPNSHSSGQSAKNGGGGGGPFIKLTSDKLKRNNKLSKAVDNIYKRKTKIPAANDVDVCNAQNESAHDNVFVDTHNFGPRIDCEDYEDYDEEADETCGNAGNLDDEEEGEYVDQTGCGEQDENAFQHDDDEDFEDEEEDGDEYSSKNNAINNMESRVKLISLIGSEFVNLDSSI